MKQIQSQRKFCHIVPVIQTRLTVMSKHSRCVKHKGSERKQLKVSLDHTQ